MSWHSTAELLLPYVFQTPSGRPPSVQSWWPR